MARHDGNDVRKRETILYSRLSGGGGGVKKKEEMILYSQLSMEENLHYSISGGGVGSTDTLYLEKNKILFNQLI